MLKLVRTVFNKLSNGKEKQAKTKAKKRDTNNKLISLADHLMAGLAVFNLKFPSLLKYDQNKRSPKIAKNLHKLYGIKHAPSDTHLRENLDEVEPHALRVAFKKIFSALQRGKVLEDYRYLNDSYLLSIDGTGQYSSNKIHCENCCEKHHRDGHISYYHQMLGAAMVHPEKKLVIPFAPEAITKQDGASKNDCERNSTKRLLNHIRREHPHLKLIILEDGLASNGPHINLLKELNMSFILGAKETDHKFLFDWVNNSIYETHERTDKDGTKHRYRFINEVPLNDAHFDLNVNFLEYWQEKKDGSVLHFSWVTDIKLSANNVYKVMRAGRARWRIENETFNTLKNQGYKFEHNYGHGDKNLCSVFTMLMLLAFLIDQVQFLCCALFNKAKATAGTYRDLWSEMRFLFRHVVFESWELFYTTIAESPLSEKNIDSS